MKLKKTIIFILKIVIIVVIVAWIALFVFDYFRATNGTKPTICLKEETIEVENGTYYRCTSFGYKYYEYVDNDQNTSYGFGAAFIQNDLEKELGV